MTWIFGYGSLMWKPGFVFERREPALPKGYRRWFCSISRRNRGTPAFTGMMMNLAPGGCCTGVAYRVAESHLAGTRAYLDKREGEARANRRIMLPVKLLNSPGAVLQNAWAYMPMVTNRNYMGLLPVEEMLPRFAGYRARWVPPINTCASP